MNKDANYHRAKKVAKILNGLYDHYPHLGWTVSIYDGKKWLHIPMNNTDMGK